MKFPFQLYIIYAIFEKENSINIKKKKKKKLSF